MGSKIIVFISKIKISFLMILLLLKKVFNSYNEITIFINKTISSQIICTKYINYTNYIFEVDINGKKSNIKDYYNLLNDGINEITIKFNKSLDTCSYMFAYLENIVFIDTWNFDSSDVKNVYGMFERCSSLTSLDLRRFNTSSVLDMGSMFFGCSSLLSLDLRSFNTSSVTDMYGMFGDCSSLKSLDLSSFNTSSVRDMRWMFYRCSSLITLNVSAFDTSSVIFMGNMFSQCYSLISLNLNSFNTSSVTDMGVMFYGCSSLLSLNLSSINTSSATDMSAMFYGCSSLLSLDLKSFDTSSVEDMKYMFYNCSSLKSLKLDQFDVSSAKNMKYMFSNCSSLISLNLSNFYTITNNYNITGIFSDCNPNLKYCINDNMAYNYRFLNSLEYFHKNCSEICIIYNEKKYIREKYLCINYCSSDNKYKYEYNNICYEEYPDYSAGNPNIEIDDTISGNNQNNDTTGISNSELDDSANNSIKDTETNDTAYSSNTTEYVRINNSEKKHSSGLIIGIICGGAGLIIIIIIVLIVLYNKNIICKKNENDIQKETKENIETQQDISTTSVIINKKPIKKNDIPNDISTNKIQIYHKEKILKEPMKIKAIFIDNKTKCEINVDPETTMEKIIDMFYLKNKIQTKNKYFLCGGKNILIDCPKSKIKEFNMCTDDNVLQILVREFD